MESLRQRLAGVSIFSGLPDDVLDGFVTNGSTVKYPSGSEIVREGAQEAGLHLILSGQAEVAVGDKVVASLGPGEYFGEIAVIDGGPRSATVRAAGDESTKTFRISPAGFWAVVGDNPTALRQLLVSVAGILRNQQG
jgi:CRP-like cAMP-binding protein